ncbi:hypothetical protein DN412_41370 [Cupriavidus lacunae]|uniref:Uncharacterized protein n=2 Tax=Cupriavidus lacunae TaxID=2666307 RepID=A0A370MXT4_9BURK|nr:hypothetical protein DN412_41370 [Cupriavidus lacunae]
MCDVHSTVPAMTAFAAPAPTLPVWSLDRCRWDRLNPASGSLYLLVDESRHLPIAAALTEESMGVGIGAWLVAATIGRQPPATLQLAGSSPEADWPALRDWARTYAVVIARVGVRQPGPAEALLRSALRALDAERGAGHDRLPSPLAQQRLDRWYRSQGGR